MIEPYDTHLAQHGRDPETYVLELSRSHDVVILGERLLPELTLWRRRRHVRPPRSEAAARMLAMLCGKMEIPLIDQIKIQARVMVPLIKALQAELGEERANAIVRSALGAHYRELGEKWWRSQRGDTLGDKLASTFETFAAADALDYDVVHHGADTFAVDVTGCRYAQFYQQLGVPELGFLLICSADFAMAEGFHDTQLTRTQTIMQGAGHCDFRYTLKKPSQT